MRSEARCPFDPACGADAPCPYPDACSWYVDNGPGGHCAARDPDEVLLRCQIAGAAFRSG